MKKIQPLFWYIILIVCSFYSCDNYMYNDNDLANILGIDVEIDSKEYAFEEFAGLQGEGCLINKYILSQETVSKFIQFEEKGNFPQANSYKENWLIQNWSNGFAQNQSIIDLFTIFEQHNNSELSRQISLFKDDLDNSNNLCSYFYKSSIDDPYALEIYVLNPDTRVLWVINITT